MRCLVAAAFFVMASVVTAASADDPPATFEITVGGELADRLPEHTTVHFWNRFRVDEFRAGTLPTAHYLDGQPIRLPFEQFRDDHWFVDFCRPCGQTILSVSLSRDLFTTPRRIEILLDEPTPSLRPTWLRIVNYSPSITRRMQYVNLPRWDEASGTFGQPVRPTLRITRISDGSLVQSGAVETTDCMICGLYLMGTFHDGETYGLTAVYDSGGLFDPIVTRREFTYSRGRHGPIRERPPAMDD